MSRDTKTSRCDMRASPTREGGQRAKSINIEYGAYFIILLRKDGCVRTPAERASPSRPTRRRSDCNALVIDQVIGESDGGIRERERERENGFGENSLSLRARKRYNFYHTYLCTQQLAG